MSRHSYDPVYAARQTGDFILADGAAAGVCVALFDYFRPHSGIDGSWGALLVVASTLLLVLAASLVLALYGRTPSWQRLLISAAILLGLSWGSVTIGRPVITKSGLVFIGASMDSRVRAIDLKTGDVLWRALVDAPSVAMPVPYTYKGRDYVVFVAGGNSILMPNVSDQVIAFALPR